MGKLHEVLAVEDSLATVFRDVVQEACKTFKTKDHLFKGRIQEVNALTETESGSLSVPEGIERHNVVETVPSKLRYIGEHMAKYLDAIAQKEIGNTQAKADLIVGGVKLIESAPATLLLALENKLKVFHAAVASIPTNDMAKTWKSTDTDHIFAADPEKKYITKKMDRHKVVIAPTEHQPGQFSTYTEDINVGIKSVTHMSGMISPKAKSDLLSKLGGVILACKKSRQRANTQPVDDVKIGERIVDFVLG